MSSLLRPTLARVHSWPLSAVLTTITLVLAAIAFAGLWVTGTRPWGGPLAADSVGAIGSWVAGVLTAVAIYYAYRQFEQTQRGVLAAEHRAEALKLTAWCVWSDAVAWTRPNAAADPGGSPEAGAVCVLNGASTTIYDWRIHVIPGSSWTAYVRLSARLGVLPPGGVCQVVDRSAPSNNHQFSGPPRFVVLTFNDAWGNSWVRMNGDLIEVPQDKRLFGRIVHLRNPAMDWAGLIDEPTWQVFHEAVGSPQALPRVLAGLFVANRTIDEDGTIDWQGSKVDVGEHVEKTQPWLGNAVVKTWSKAVEDAKLVKTGIRATLPDRRGRSRNIDRRQAYTEVRAFFQIAKRGEVGDVMYIRPE